MNDFLTNLSARSFGPAYAIHPRPVSLFEPARGKGISSLFPAHSMTTDEIPAFQNMESETTNQHEPFNHLPDTVPKPRHPVSSTRTLMPMNLIPEKSEAEDKTLSPYISRRGTSPHQHNTILDDTKRPQRNINAYMTRSLLSEKRTEGHDSPISQVNSDLELQGTASPATINLPGSAITTEESTPKKVLSLRQPFMNDERIADLTRTSVARRDSEKTKPTTAQLPIESGPSIQVTIGRIEIRAVPPPAAVRERSILKAMSLDEYLRRRLAKGGGG